MSRFALFALSVALLNAQIPTLKDLMLDLIHPASNDLLLTINRGGPSTDQEWTTARRNALALVESGPSLAAHMNTDPWRAAVKQLSDAAADVWKAAQSKDTKALATATARVDASCTSCHKQFRPNVFPRAEESAQAARSVVRDNGK